LKVISVKIFYGKLKIVVYNVVKWTTMVI
jgi:hypothetical protein